MRQRVRAGYSPRNVMIERVLLAVRQDGVSLARTLVEDLRKLKGGRRASWRFGRPRPRDGWRWPRVSPRPRAFCAPTEFGGDVWPAEEIYRSRVALGQVLLKRGRLAAGVAERVAPGRKGPEPAAGCAGGPDWPVFPAAIKRGAHPGGYLSGHGQRRGGPGNGAGGYQRVYRRLSQLRRVAGLTDSERRAWEETLGTYRKRRKFYEQESQRWISSETRANAASTSSTKPRKTWTRP